MNDLSLLEKARLAVATNPRKRLVCTEQDADLFIALANGDIGPSQACAAIGTAYSTSILSNRLYRIVMDRKLELVKPLVDAPEPDSRLISAAPDLLWALEQIVQDIPAERDWLHPDLEKMAREAIRKARGAA